MFILGNALSGVPAVDPAAEADVLQGPEVEAHVLHQRAGVDAEGCVLYRLQWVEDGRLMYVWTDQFRRLETGGWTRNRTADCVKTKSKAEPSRSCIRVYRIDPSRGDGAVLLPYRRRRRYGRIVLSSRMRPASPAARIAVDHGARPREMRGSAVERSASPVTRTLNCWKCGSALDDVPVPFARIAECPRCRADLHVCRMCEFFDPGVRRGCREPVADDVTDRERANFCGYFTPAAGTVPPARDGAARAARSDLDALFGLSSAPTGPPGDADEAKRRLDALFGDESGT